MAGLGPGPAGGWLEQVLVGSGTVGNRTTRTQNFSDASVMPRRETELAEAGRLAQQCQHSTLGTAPFLASSDSCGAWSPQGQREATTLDRQQSAPSAANSLHRTRSNTLPGPGTEHERSSASGTSPRVGLMVQPLDHTLRTPKPVSRQAGTLPENGTDPSRLRAGCIPPRPTDPGQGRKQPQATGGAAQTKGS